MPALAAALALQAPHSMFNAAAAAPSATDPTPGPTAAPPPSSAGAPSVPSLPSGFESLALALLGLPGQGLGQGGGFELALLTMQAAAAAAAAGAGAGAGLLPAALLGAGLSLPGGAAGSSGGPFALGGAGVGLGLASGAAAGVRASQVQAGPSSYSSTYRGVCRLEAKDVSQHNTRRGKGSRAGQGCTGSRAGNGCAGAGAHLPAVGLCFVITRTCSCRAACSPLNCSSWLPHPRPSADCTAWHGHQIRGASVLQGPPAVPRALQQRGGGS